MQGKCRTIKPGMLVSIIGGYSEVMCHMGLHGKRCRVELLARHDPSDGRTFYSAQIHVNGKPFSSPITTGEAGIYSDGKGGFYTYEASPEDIGDENPQETMRAMVESLNNAIVEAGGNGVMVIRDLGLNF